MVTDGTAARATNTAILVGRATIISGGQSEGVINPDDYDDSNDHTTTTKHVAVKAQVMEPDYSGPSANGRYVCIADDGQC